MWWMRIIGVPANGPPIRPSCARNSSMILALNSLASPGAASAVSVIFSSGGLGVFIMAADPGLERLALVASLRHPVEDRVVAHQELHPAPRGRIGLVDDTVVAREDGHGRGFRQVPD